MILECVSNYKQLSAGAMKRERACLVVFVMSSTALDPFVSPDPAALI